MILALMKYFMIFAIQSNLVITQLLPHLCPPSSQPIVGKHLLLISMRIIFSSHTITHGILI